VIDKNHFGGIVIVELDDGTKVEAIWYKSFGDQMIGGMKLLVAPTMIKPYMAVLYVAQKAA
jgi:hypothetical protein